MNNLIGQHIIIGLSGLTLTSEEKQFIVENDIGGVVLFARNVQSPEQIAALTKELQNLRHQTTSKAPLFIGIDMEGGRVARLKAPFTQWPPIKKLGDMDSPNAAFSLAYFMGMELKSVGINLDFAPCIDIFTNPQNTVIGDRSPGIDAELVARIGSALVRGYVKADVIPCPKHFPGHGNTLIDSHEDLPIEDATLDRLKAVELIPFRKAFRSRANMLMTAHIKFTNVDPEWPVTLSELFLKKILRQDLRYRGLIITDDLDMKALAKHYDKKKIPVQALKAGADLLLYCNEPDSPPKALEGITKSLESGELNKKDLETTYKRILDIKNKTLTKPEPFAPEEYQKIIGHTDHFRLSQALIQGVIPQGLVGKLRDED